MDCVETFSVDDFLDLSNTEALESLFSSQDDEQEQEQEQEREKAKTFSDQSTLEDLLSLPSTELNVPVGDLEDLEWLSNFVDDSFSESYLSGDFPVNPAASVEVQRQCVPVKPRSKRRRKNGRVWSLESKQKAETSFRGGGGRCCSHCGVQKTPQWRMGPLGAKTLCNACGVRFKSGRLLPEYRPACSPTFSAETHSNSHRRVLELRLKKTVEPGRV